MPRVVALPDETMWPVRFALVVTVPAVRLAAVPDALVITPDAGVPRAGVVSVGAVNVLFVRVCEPVRVVTVLSILTVTVLVLAAVLMPVPPAISRVSESRSMLCALPESASTSRSAAVATVST